LKDGIDYSDTFSPMVKSSNIRAILALSVHFQWPTRQLDVSNAFLYGTLDKEVFMEQPQGFVDRKFPKDVCRLHKSIYGPKQAPRSWFNKLASTLLNLRFTESKVDYLLFIFHVQHLPHGLHLSQSKYISNVLDRAKMSGAKPAKTPLPTGSKLSQHDGDPLENASKYRHLVGALQYCTLTIPDISFAVNQLCQFLHSPTTTH
jgi:hypothetical protein